MIKKKKYLFKKGIITKNQKNGITLIALVVTIIVLLILAGISISMLSSDNGILRKATNAKEHTGIGQEKEIITLAYNSALAKKISNGDSTAVTSNNLNSELINQGASANGSNPIIVTFNSSNRQYKISSNGTIEIIIDEELTDLEKLRGYFIGNNYIVLWDDNNGNYGTLDGLPIDSPENEITNSYTGNGEIILYNNHYYELRYANNDYNDVIENVVEYEEPPYSDNWIVAWAYNGLYWSNPYTRENGLFDSYFEYMDSNYSIGNTSELDSANILALLYENENDSSTYKLVMVGTGTIVGDEHANGQSPWNGYYHRQNWNELFCDYDFESTFCSNITRLEIQEGITEIGVYAFYSSKISYAYIPDSVQLIRRWCF